MTSRSERNNLSYICAMASSPTGFTPGDPPAPVTSVFALPILIIDDQPADLEILADCLHDEGFENVQAAVGGASGIGVLADAGTGGEAPAVVVVDMRMPSPDGNEVLARIAEMDVGCRPLALAVTGDSSSVTRNAALQAGASDFITNPFDIVELRLRVRNLALMKQQERELCRALEHRRLAGEYRILADNSVDVIIHHRGREIVWISPSVEPAFGWSREQWLGTEFLRHIHPDDIDIMSATLDEIEQGRSITARVRVAIADGGYCWVEGRAKPYNDAAGNADGMIAALRVVDDHVQAERLRVEAEKRYQLLFEAAPDALIIAGPDGRITLANAQSELLFGYPCEELIGSQVDMLVPTRLRGDHAAHRMGFFADPGVRPMGVGLELWGLRKDGSEFPIAISLSPVRIGSHGEVLAAIRDVTERREAEQRVTAERQRFEAVVKASPSAVSVMNLQGRYTMVNDAFCELFDQVSVAAAVGRTAEEVLPHEVWKAQRRAITRLLAGDDSPAEESMRRGLGSISLMTQRFALRDSVGAITEVVTIRTDITYRKKALQEAVERSLWEERVGAAAGRLLAYSQPIVDIATRATVDEELLVRLRVADTNEILPPAQFLPQCEHFHLMPVIDRYMVGRAIELARAGRSVSVNITGQTIADEKTLNEIVQMLAIAGHDVTGKIMFEITETTASAAPALAKAFSRKVGDLGCRVALDDFGTGYGTFTELRHLHLHVLKIDMSFVANMLDDPDDERVVTTIVSVARAYGLSTIAEGVESEAVLEKLAELGVDRAQGYLFAKPKPVV